MGTILVGTDFSANSDRAFDKACEIAQGGGQKVHLLHVVEAIDDADSPDPDTKKFYEALIEASRVKMEAEIAANRRAIEVTYSVEIGPRASTILEMADTLGAEMVAVGSVARTAESQHRLGVGHCVALTSKRPVLLVP
jgi:nucleotide-binding universal stress UspA family protein